MTHQTASSRSDRQLPGYFSPARLGRDCAYVLPGFFISLFGFLVLVPLFALSLGTVIIWVGALLLPLTLTIARGFAQLSRARVRHWGGTSVLGRYRPAESGMVGWVRTAADPRLWLDLVFETVIALPLRILTFSVAVSWMAAAAGGVTFFFWGAFLPGERTGALQLFLEVLSDGAVPSTVAGSFALEGVWNLLLGVLFLLSLPGVMRGLARLDAAVTVAALGTGADGTDPGPAAHDSPSAGPIGPFPSGGSSDDPDPSTRLPAPSPPDRSDSPRSTDPAGTPSSYSNLSSHGTSSRSRLTEFASAQAWTWLAAGFAAAVLLAVAWPVTAVVYAVPTALAMVAAIVQSASLLAAVRWPALGVLSGGAGVFATAWFTADALGLPWPWPATALVSYALLGLLLALRHPWPYAVVAWLTGAAASILAAALRRPDWTAGSLDSIIIATSIAAGMVLLGIGVRQLVHSRARVRHAEEANAQQSARTRELTERNRIAQELHDVVAHSMSVISVQATTAAYRLPDVGDDAGREFSSIADSSRRALTEMRGLLTILRGATDAPLVPQPTLTDVPALLDSTRQSGATITAPADLTPVLETAASRTSTATGLTAYRILQEALSNAVRHAPGAAIAVSVALTDTDLALEVDNGPPPDAPSSAPHASASRSPRPHTPDPHPPAPGAGLGLAGIRERAAALGGTISAGPRADGGFAVHARLPTL